MKKFRLEDFTRGWFVGAFKDGNCIWKTDKCEVAVKRYKKNEVDAKHFHLEADEISCIISGRVLMNGIEYGPDDIILTQKGEATDYIPITDEVVSVVVKTGSVPSDKFLVSDKNIFILCDKCGFNKEQSVFKENAKVCNECDQG